MSAADKKKISQRFKGILAALQVLSQRYADQPDMTQGLYLLQSWQSERLEKTYADLAAQKNFRKAMQFFLSDLYGPVDFSGRDRDIERVYPLMVRALSADAIAALADGMELHRLSIELDHQLLEVLVEQLDFDPNGSVSQLNMAKYAQAYKICDNRESRLKQIALIVAAGRQLEVLTKKRLILAAVKIARKPAKLAGFDQLQGFIERGLVAFRAMANADVLLTTIESRELELLDKLFES